MTDDGPVTSGDHTDAVDREAVARHAVDPDAIESAGAAARQSAPGDARRAGPLPATSDNAGTPFDVSRSRRIAIRIGLLGPAFVAAVAYVDPGNVAANLQAGARYGYLLVWVLVDRDRIGRRRSVPLGQAGPGDRSVTCPNWSVARLGRPARFSYWLQAEAVAMATDLAEVIGGAIASPCCSTCRCCSVGSSPASCRSVCWRCRTAAASDRSSG